MSFKSIVVVCPNARRETVNVSPNTSILQILEEACKKQKLNPHDYDLRHYNRILDLTLPLRFANIPNNALLELHPTKSIRTECKVTVALQLESGERYTKDFDASSTISDVIAQCLSSQSVAPGDLDECVCIYMRQKITSDAIKTTTLRSLGLTKGQAIIRLLCRKPADMEHQAHVSTPLLAPITSESTIRSQKRSPPSSPIAEPVGKHTCQSTSVYENEENKEHGNSENKITENFTPVGTDNDMTDVESTRDLSDFKSNVSRQNEVINDINDNNKLDNKSDIQKMEFDDVEDVPIGEIIYVGGQQAVLYSLDAITSVRKADLPDEFFDLTINDAKYLMEEYKKQRVEMENQPLLTKEQREKQILKNLAKYSQTVLRIYFPERLVLQVVFTVLDTVQTVCDFIREFLEDRDLKFYLYTTPPKQILHSSKTLLESMLVPASVLYFGCDVQQSSYLHKSLRDKISDPRAAALAAVESRKNNVSNNTDIVFSSDNVDEQMDFSQSLQDNSSRNNVQNSTETQNKKIPSWFKMKPK